MTISARDRHLTLVERAARNVDWAAVERAESERIVRANVERREFLYSRLFRDVSRRRDLAGLRTESAAQELFARALASADDRLQLGILRVAVDHRWRSVVTAFIKHWSYEHPIAVTVEELWTLTLTTSRTAD